MIPVKQMLNSLTVTGWIPSPEYFAQLSMIILEEVNFQEICYDLKVKKICYKRHLWKREGAVYVHKAGKVYRSKTERLEGGAI